MNTGSVSTTPAPLPSTTYETLYCYSSSLGQALTQLAAREGLRIVCIAQQHNDFMVHVTYYYETLEEEEDRLYPPKFTVWEEPSSRPLVSPDDFEVSISQYRLDHGFDENVMDDDGAPPTNGV